MRVLMVIPSMTPEAGAEQSIAAVLPYLVAGGTEVDIAVLTGNQGLVPEVERAGARIHDLSTSRGVALVRDLRTILRRRRPDLIHATLFQASVRAQLAALGSRIPVLVTWANTPTERATEQAAPWKLAIVHGADVVFAHIDGVRFHAVTPGVARTKAAELRVRPERVVVAERGRDPERFHPPSDQLRTEARNELGIAADDIVVLAIGRQEPQKAYPDLVRAFDHVAAADRRVRLVIAGRSGSGTPLLERAIDDAVNGDRVSLLGHRDDVVGVLAAADVVVCASHREGAAGALIEAMACGVPIVTVRLDGLEGVLEDGVNARVVERGRLSDGLQSVLQDPIPARQRADAARSLFLDRFTVEHSAQALQRAYDWTLSNSRAGRRRW